MGFLERFKSVKKSGAGWVCRCPAHDDGQNSLSIKRADDKWLLRPPTTNQLINQSKKVAG